MAHNNAILILVYQDDPQLLKQAKHDSGILIRLAPDTERLVARTVTRLVEVMEDVRPSVLYLFADFDKRGMLYDREKRSMSLGQLMKRAEAIGVSLFFIANEINPDILDKSIRPATRGMIFGAMLDRNQHFADWLHKLFQKTVQTGDFIKSYVELAPQFRHAQQHMQLPGSVVIPPQG
jgi:hypothetical protein